MNKEISIICKTGCGEAIQGTIFYISHKTYHFKVYSHGSRLTQALCEILNNMTLLQDDDLEVKFWQEFKYNVVGSRKESLSAALKCIKMYLHNK